MKKKKENGVPALYQTRWSRSGEPQNTWKEYPRPAMVRASYINLNGLWDYCFTRSNSAPSQFSGQIAVPFSPEAPLSGVGRQLRPDEYLWYRRSFTLPSRPDGWRVLLHFGAVDQECTVFVNGKTAGTHTGGYLPFTLDITDWAGRTADELLVRVRDYSDASYYSRGKQKLHNGGMFYTAQSGIWQTVWLELVPDPYIAAVLFTPDYDGSCCRVRVHTKGGGAKGLIRCTVRPETEADRRYRDDPLHPVPERQSSSRTDASAAVNTFTLAPGREAILPLPGFHAWSPEDPFLYHAALEMGDDHVECYFAMRKCDIRTGSDGLRRIFLNNSPYMQTGVLDQGYWPDGLYTAPCDEAFIYDIRAMKELGFNMLRKHVKIEPQRWYYHCDRLGMLVWQDMVCGGSTYRHWFVTYLATLFNAMHVAIKDGKQSRFLLSRRDAEGRKQFLRETKDTIEALRVHPSIVCWVPFNEGWGQFDAMKTADFVRSLDPTRLIDHASGWFDQKGGDLCSLHYYFFTLKFRPEPVRALALTEFGGYSWQIPGHSCSEKLYGYGKYNSRQALTEGYRRLLADTILPAVKKGISATIYTQLSDVEEEVNGLYTYDREILKPDGETVRRLNQELKDAVNRCTRK